MEDKVEVMYDSAVKIIIYREKKPFEILISYDMRSLETTFFIL